MSDAVKSGGEVGLGPKPSKTSIVIGILSKDSDE